MHHHHHKDRLIQKALLGLSLFAFSCDSAPYNNSPDATHLNETWGEPVVGLDAGMFEAMQATTDCVGKDICNKEPLRISNCTMDIWEAFRIDENEAPSADSNQYQRPSEARRDALFEAINSADIGDEETALRFARSAGYTLCRLSDALLLLPDRPEQGGARIAWRQAASSPAIFEAPHTFYDLGTHTQAVELFMSLKARAVIVSGTHRCASHQESKCDGTGQICGRSEKAFKDSDMAHSSHSFFQVMHEFLSLRYQQDWIFSLHGMSDDGISISDGTTFSIEKDTAPAQLGAAFQRVFPNEYISSCNPYDGATVEYRLCGTTNIQGRFVNGANRPCMEPAQKSSGRFIHMEQSRSIRNQNTKVAEAIRMALMR